MTAKLSKDLADALHAQGDNKLEVVDPSTNRVYILIDSDTHREAMEALRQQQDLESIRRGVQQMEAGEGRPLAEADADVRRKLGFSPRQ